jgi:hypothetical protein
MFQPDQALRSLTLVSWRRADYYVQKLVSGLNLGITGCRPFLKRSECVRLRRQLVRIETLTRRVLVLFVLEGPLPHVTVRAGQAAPGRRPSRIAPRAAPFLYPAHLPPRRPAPPQHTRATPAHAPPTPPLSRPAAAAARAGRVPAAR